MNPQITYSVKLCVFIDHFANLKSKSLLKINYLFWRNTDNIKSIEEAQNLSTSVTFPSVFMIQNSLRDEKNSGNCCTELSCKDKVSKLSWWEDVGGPFFIVCILEIKSRWDNSTFIDPSQQLYNNLLRSMIINHFKFSYIVFTNLT